MTSSESLTMTTTTRPSPAARHHDTTWRLNDTTAAATTTNQREQRQQNNISSDLDSSRPSKITFPTNPSDDPNSKPSKSNCDRRRPDELEDASRLPNMSQQLTGQMVTPFLREHIPGIYAPIGKPESLAIASFKNPNSKYCYRHRPDSKCRRAADESKMALIQRV